MPMNEKGNPLDRLIGAMKVPTKGSRGALGRQQEAAVLASMEIDNTVHSSRIKAFPSSRKRVNGMVQYRPPLSSLEMNEWMNE